MLVEEKTSAPLGPRFPRRYASKRQREQQQQQPRLRESQRAISRESQSGRCKLASLHKARRFFEQQFAVGRRRIVTREFDQIAAIQKVAEQRTFVGGKMRSAREMLREIPPKSGA